MTDTIVRTFAPLALLGGAQIAPPVLNILQRHAATFVAADGGAEHLLAACLSPQAVIGDLDSVSAAARAAFGPVFHRIEDQSRTDFEKAVGAIKAPLILAAGFLGGRLDHTMSVLNTMGRLNLRHLILVSEDDVCFLSRSVRTDLTLRVGTRVGLLPLGATRVDTKGLRWDITDAEMAPDGFISTSNETAEPKTIIHSTGALLITLPLAALDAVIDVVHAK